MRRMRQPFRAIFLTSLLLAAPLSAHSATIQVPADFPTIQGAVDAAADGDTIRVAAGLYRENVTIDSKAVSLVGAQGPGVTTIDGGGTGRVITVLNTGAGRVSVSGFTLANGAVTFESGFPGPGQGGAIYAESSSIVVQGNVITGNRGCLGLAIHTLFSQITLIGNQIVGNIAEFHCGTEAVFLRESSGGESRVSDNLIADHQATGIVLQRVNRVIVQRNILRNNVAATPDNPFAETGGVYSVETGLTLEDNVFAHNVGLSAGGALVVDDLTLGTIISGNSFTGNQGAASALQLVGFSRGDFRVVGNLFEAPLGVLAVRCDGTVAISRRNSFVPFSSSALSGCIVSP